MSQGTPMPGTDLTVTAARTERDRLADRTDVLDNVVGQLRTLPDNTHMSTEMVAAVYEVDSAIIRQLVKRNLNEITSDGYRTVTRADVSDILSLTWSELGFPEKAHTAALFPRRAVLRVGMLLRDSDVARRVRDMLLDVEHADARPSFDPATLTRQEILRIALNAEEERLALEAENQVLAPKAEAYDSFLDATGKYSVGAVAKMLGTSQNKLFRDLRNAGVFIAKGGMRNTPYQQYLHHFEVIGHEYERSNGEPGCSYTTYVQPSGIDFIRRKLGLPSIDPQPAQQIGGAA